MHLSHEQAMRFYRLFDALIAYTNDMYKVTDELFDYETMGMYPDELIDVSEVLWSDLTIIDSFIEKNPFGFNACDLEDILLWKTAISDNFVLIEHNLAFSIFTTDEFAFGVKGISHGIEELLPKTPTIVKTTLLPFDNAVIYAMHLVALPLSFGPDMHNTFRSFLERAISERPLITDALDFIEASAERQAMQHTRATEDLLLELEERVLTEDNEVLMPGMHKGVLAGLSEAERERTISLKISEINNASGLTRASFLKSTSLKKEPLPTLREIHNLLTKDDLKYLAKLSDLQRYSRLRKTELLNMVVCGYSTNKAKWEDFLKLCDQATFDTYVLLVKADGVLSLSTQEVDTLEYPLRIQPPYSYSFFSDDVFTLLIPEDFKQWYPLLPVNEIQQRRQEQGTIMQYPKIYTELCGITDAKELYTLYREHGAQKPDEDSNNQLYRYKELGYEDFIATIIQEIMYDDLDFEYWFYEDKLHFVNFKLGDTFNMISELDDEEGTGIGEYRKSILSRHKDIPMKTIERDKMFDFNAFSFSVALPQAIQLRNFFDAYVPDEADDYFFADKLMEDIYEMAQYSYEAPEYLKHFEDLGLKYDLKTSNTLLLLLSNCLNSIPLWTNNGWSPVELLERETGKKIFYNADGSIRSVGRNDLCPCGSGKKYKHCCG